MIELNKPIAPNISKLTEYLDQVNSCGWYTNFGPLHQLLTSRLEEYLGVKNLLLVSNGTLALQVAYKTLNVQHALTTPFSFVATTSSLLWQNTKVSFSDIDRASYNLCSKEAQKALEADRSIDTIVGTHVYGNPCDVSAFEGLAKTNNVKIIYDAAHAFGVKINNKSVLDYGDASTLSFHATKIFHTVEGGAIIFKQKSDYERAKKLINFGLDTNGKITDVGINAKLNEYQCAVGLTLLEQMDDIAKHRAYLYKIYCDGLKDIVEIPQWNQQASFNGSYMPIYIDDIIMLQQVIDSLADKGVQSRRYFTPPLNEVFHEIKNSQLNNSTKISAGILCLPLHYSMSQNDVNFVISALKNILNENIN